LGEHKFSTPGIPRTSCKRETKFGTVTGLANRQLLPNLVNFGLLLRGAKFTTVDISHMFVGVLQKFGSVRGIGEY